MTDEAELLSEIVEKMADHDFAQKVSELVAATRAVVDGETIESDGVSEVNTRLLSVLRTKLRYFEGEE